MAEVAIALRRLDLNSAVSLLTGAGHFRLSKLKPLGKVSRARSRRKTVLSVG